MIEINCGCGAMLRPPLAALNSLMKCGGCQCEISCVCAEELTLEACGGDFDAALTVLSGPSSVGRVIRLGGCAEISIGKAAGNTVVLPGKLLSRAHLKLVRLDFGPSRWALEDNNSTNGTAVNGQRIARHELCDGDVIRAGEYELAYAVAAPWIEQIAQPTAARASEGGGNTCPSCLQPLASTTRICVSCGIRVDTGRPLLISQGMDLDAVHQNARTVVSVVSWLVPVTPLPIPLASEAYGHKKPYAIWAIVAITVLASIVFALAGISDPHGESRNLMLWPVSQNAALAVDHLMRDPRFRNLSTQQDELKSLVMRAIQQDSGEFHWWQLFTHALLHDRSSLTGFLLHLGGNMLFMIVFGSRVNSIIGNLATAAIYPVLAVGAAMVYLMTLPVYHFGPMLGASGAINGLAGMYLILFPAHRVYCGMWIRLRFRMWFKVFALRGFWVLLIYLAFDTLMVLLGSHGGTAHWAHIGGFLTGMVVAMGLLVSRRFDCRNGDLLSLSLGKYAWPLIGKPNRWMVAAA